MPEQRLTLAVAGGTGAAGRHVVDVAAARGHSVVVLSRSAGVDAVTGEGLADALRGVDVVVDVLNVTTMKAARSAAFFQATTRNLLAAESDAGVAHHVALSIVHCDRAPHDYYAGKVAQERLIEASSTPSTILRTTQFHEFAMQVFGMAAFGPLHLAPLMRTQPVALREVAVRLVTVAEGAPQGRARDLAGPREESLPEMVRAFARATGRRGWVAGIPAPGPLGRAQRDGTLLPDADAERGSQTFAQWVATLPPSDR